MSNVKDGRDLMLFALKAKAKTKQIRKERALIAHSEANETGVKAQWQARRVAGSSSGVLNISRMRDCGASSTVIAV